MVSPDETDNALWINQNARFALTNLQGGAELTYTNRFEGNVFFIVLINGRVNIGTSVLEKRDALGISESVSCSITATEDAELLVIEIPMNY